ncbi:MAG: phosphodiester glycosidase family protein [Alphaproteobacteria bacterium]|nr:phosphodiester glycosidase family protein [Alphaproteobacteria bacterium]
MRCWPVWVVALAGWGSTAVAGTREDGPAAGEGPTPIDAQALPGLAAARIGHLGNAYAVVEVELGVADLQLMVRDRSGAPLGSFDRVADAFSSDGRALRFATNAGMFHPGGAPVGLAVVEGVELAPLETRFGAPGNFYLAPNGVFWIDEDGSAHVDETGAFATLRPADVWMATQSGPMLVIHGELHPAFRPESVNAHVRSGVGVLPDGRVALVMSLAPVPFYDLASLFRDVLHVQDALYLDGAISRMFAPELGLTAPAGGFGPILAVGSPPVEGRVCPVHDGRR